MSDQRLPSPHDATLTVTGSQPNQLVSEPPLPMNIGVYRILGLLGRGGMGAVYRAEQPSPRRVVALKVIASSFVSRQLLRRFELEAQTLGRLKHVGVAQIYEAGTADSGHGTQPFFAMELVEGVPLDEYAAEHQLSTPERLQLLIKLCEAVQYAHQQGVIHRDLKPGNILVTTDGQPKVLDFGVARAIESDVQATTLQTDLGQLVGTLPYMSPEQASGDSDEIDTRSDVYALGVIAYELLSGRLPHDLRGMKTLEAARRILQDEPSRLSSIDRRYRGDVETIVQKALEKDKTRRYQTANALAADVKRYLNYEPISARPPGAWYQLSKFAKRNRALVGGAMAVFVVLICGVIVSVSLYIRAERERAEAKIQSEVATGVNQFLTERVLAGATPAQMPNKAVRDEIVKKMLDPAAISVAKDFKDKPLVEAAVRHSLAKSYSAIGRIDLAVPHGEAALAIRRRLLTPEDPETLRSIDTMGALFELQGNRAKAEPLLRESLERRRRVLGDDHTDTLTSINNMATLLGNQDKSHEAEPLRREALHRSRRVLGDTHPTTLTSIIHMGQLLQEQGKLGEAEAFYREALEVSRRSLGSDHPDTLFSLYNLSALLATLGKFAEAEPLSREVMEGSRRVLGDDHPYALDAINGMGRVLQVQGRLAEAEPLLREALERRRRVLGDDHDETLTSINNLGVLLCSQGKLAEAEALLCESLEKHRRVVGNEHYRTLGSMNHLGHLLQLQGKLTESEPLHREATYTAKVKLGREHAYTKSFAANYTRCLSALGRNDEAAAVRMEFGLPEPMTRPVTRPTTAPASQP